MNTQAFTSMENLTGDAVVDTFIFLNGFSILGIADGADGADVLDLGLYATATNVVLSGLGATDGFNGDVGGIAGFANMDAIQGAQVGAPTNTFTASNDPNNFIDITGSGKVTNGVQDIDFDNFFTDIVGGDQNDTFNIKADHTGDLFGGDGDDDFLFTFGNFTLSGRIFGDDGADLFDFDGSATIDSSGALSLDGGLGTDTLDFADYTFLQDISFDPVDGTAGRVDASAGGATPEVLTGPLSPANEFINIDTINGNDGSIFAPPGNNTWEITAQDFGTLNVTTTFNNFRLVGNDGVDTFNIQNGGFLTGELLGGDGADVVNINSGLATTIVFDNFAADSASGTIDDGVAPAAYQFSSIETISGGSAADLFTVNADFSGVINGLGEADTFDINANLSGNIDGGAAADTFNIGANLTGFVDGAAGADVFNIISAVSITNPLLGGAAADTFNVAANVTGSLDGGAAADVFNVNAVVTGNLIGATGNDDFNLNASVAGDVLGGAGDDVFDVDAAVTGSVAGGDNDDIFNLGAGAPFVVGGLGTDTLEITDTVTHAGILAISAVENILDDVVDTADDRIVTTGAGNALSITGATSIGAGGAEIETTVSNLEILTSTGNAFFVSDTGLSLANIDLGGAPGSTFNLTTTAGSISDGSGRVTADILVLDSNQRIGSFFSPIVTTATNLDLTIGGGQSGFVESQSALDTTNIELNGDGSGTQTMIVGAPSITFDEADITTTLALGFVPGDEIGFTTLVGTPGDITVTPATVDSQGLDLELVSGANLILPGTFTFDLNDAGDVNRGILGIGGNVTGVTDLTVATADAVRILEDTTLSLAALDLGTAGSVIGGADITIVPNTLGTNINVGNVADPLLNGANIAAFTGFNGGLDIGGTVDPTGVAPALAPGLAGDVTVEQPIFLGPSSTLTIAALGDILVGAPIVADQINLIALGDDGTQASPSAPGSIGACGGCIEDVGINDVIIADRAVLVANTTIGTTTNNLNVNMCR